MYLWKYTNDDLFQTLGVRQWKSNKKQKDTPHPQKLLQKNKTKKKKSYSNPWAHKRRIHQQRKAIRFRTIFDSRVLFKFFELLHYTSNKLF